MKFSDARKARYRRENVYSDWPVSTDPGKEVLPRIKPG